MRNPVSVKVLLGSHALLAMVAAVLAGFSIECHADPRDDAFYHQLVKLPATDGYRPTRTFTIITDAEHGNQLVAEDDDNLRFNLIWMQQFRPDYKTSRGGAAFGEIFRSYLKSAYKSYRDRNSGSGMLSALPDENGSLRSSHLTDGEMDYNLKLTGDEVRFRVQYKY
jgi:hypothetical protein